MKTRGEKKHRHDGARRVPPYLSLFFVLVVTYLLGWLDGPFDQPARHGKHASPTAARYDKFGRLIAAEGKSAVPCPKQTPQTGVLLVFGQSNSANHAATRMATRFPGQVFNYYDGKCYVASSPLLGATGDQGEFMTPLADRLIENGVYRTVIIIATGVEGTTIARWSPGGDLHRMLLNTLERIKPYRVTEVIWHQGESDYLHGTPAPIYERSFGSLKDSLRAASISAPLFIAIATKCGSHASWTENNPIAQAQRKLEDKKHVFIAANTDQLLSDADRQADSCHLSETGQAKTAAAYAHAIRHYRLAQ